MQNIFITGISSGIGRAAAKHFLSQGDIVIGSVRKLSDVEDLKSEFGSRLILWICDFSNLKNINLVTEFFKNNNIQHVDILINNAGIAVAAPFQFQDFSEIENTMNVNVVAVMKLTQILIPYLISSQGRIINISSISGVNGNPFLAGYCASKFALEGFSESLRREMKLHKIHVSIIGPGSIKTPIWFKNFENMKSKYSDTVFSNSFNQFLKIANAAEKKALPVSKVVDCIIHAASSKHPKIRYAPIPQKMLNWYFPRLLPKLIYDYIIVKSLGLQK